MPNNNRNGGPLTIAPGALVDGPPWGYGKGGAVIRPPNVGAGMAPLGRVLSLPLPEDSPIPDAREFNVLGSIATVGAVAAPTLVTGCTYNIPAGSYGVIRSVSIYINNMLATTDVRWTVMVDSVSQAGYAPVTMFARVAAFVGNTFDAKIRVTGPCTIAVFFQQIDGGAYTVGAALGGWEWPQASDDRWKSTGV